MVASIRNGAVVLVGPLPTPIDGCSYANEVLLRNSCGQSFLAVDTNTRLISGRQGERFSLLKALRFVSCYIWIWRVFFARCVYLTPGQTFFGLMKYAPFMATAILLRKPYVIHVHGNHLGAAYAGLTGLRKRLFRFFVARASAGIVLSESLRANFDGLLPRDHVFVVRNFAAREIYLKRLHSGKRSDKLRVLYLSNLMREKGVIELLDALVHMHGSGIPFEVVLAGNMEPGVEVEVIERLAKLGKSARYVGPVTGDEKFDLLGQANVTVLPTYYAMEGQPISLLEGLAAGNIIVTTDHAGIPDVINQSNGFLVPVRDSKALAEVLSLIARDVAGNVRRYSSHNATYAASRFTEGEFAGRVLDVLRTVMRDRGAVRQRPGDR